MRFTIKSIKISNFLSISNAELLLDLPGYTMIEGINNCIADHSTSNGAGKSSCVEAIFWAVTGATIRGVKDVTNINGTDGAMVELTFLADSHQYKITRTKDHSKLKSSLLIEIDGEDRSGKGIKDSQKLLSEYLPDLTSELLGSVIILGQGLPQKFTNNTPAGRKDLLEKLSKSEFMLDDLKTRIAARRVELDSSLRAAEDANLAAVSKKTVLTQQITEYKSELTSMLSTVDLDNLINQYTESKKLSELKLTKYKLALDELTKKRISTETELAPYTETQKTLSDKLADLNIKKAEINAAYLTRVNEVKQASETELNQLRVKLTADSTLLEAKMQELTKLEQITDICPTCGQKLINSIKPDTSSLKSEISSIRSAITKTSAEGDIIMSEIDIAVAAVQKEFREILINNNNEQLAVNNDINNVNVLISAKKNELFGIEQELSTITSDINAEQQAYNALEADIARLSQDKAIADSKRQSIEDHITAAEGVIKAAEIDSIAALAEIDSINVHIDIIKKFNTSIQRDFRGKLLVNVIDYLNTVVNTFANIVFGKIGKVEMVLDGNNIDVYLNNRIYECLSGGEKQKLDIIIQFAIRDLLCTYSGFSTNCLFLDEIFDGLDSYSTHRVLDLIAAQLTDVESVYIISHHDDLQIPMDHSITVTKSEIGLSNIVQK